MRGAQVHRALRRHVAGIIPAYAGSTRQGPCGRRSRRDHPRVCGEHSGVTKKSTKVSGSSPRMRGALRFRTAKVKMHGIIPAYAGSTRSRRSTSQAWRDHPRVCGEHICVAPNTSALMGSSPRMRGAPRALFAVLLDVGIIPAYAGSTMDDKIAGIEVGDHPRVCGEHRPARIFALDTSGSSPRMRGAQFDCLLF